jgi:hypothetical protein
MAESLPKYDLTRLGSAATVPMESLPPAFAPTLRDQFAMAALTGLMTHKGEPIHDLAIRAYRAADAMMKLREAT